MKQDTRDALLIQIAVLVSLLAARQDVGDGCVEHIRRMIEAIQRGDA